MVILKNSSQNLLLLCHYDSIYESLLFNFPLIDLVSLSIEQNSSIAKDTVVKSSTPVDLTTMSTDSFPPSTSNVVLDIIINPTKQDQIHDKKKLVAINFQYADPNSASYDLANHILSQLVIVNRFGKRTLGHSRKLLSVQYD